MRVSPQAILGADPHRIAGATLRRGTWRRVWTFASPYRRLIAVFIGAIVAGAVVSLVPPLLFRTIIDDVLPASDRGRLHLLVGLVVAAAIAEAVVSLVERWCSSRIGEGLIFDLRVALFDHVQRMPMAFFTRSQTGALVSRLNNDVIGAQRALTSTLGSVVSNVVVLVTTLLAMAALEWRLTLLALALLPVFLIPTRRVGRYQQGLTREAMGLNADMNTTMTERFNVAGAQLVKLFGRHDDEVGSFGDRAGQVRDIGVRSAVFTRTFGIALGLVGALGVAVVYVVGGHLVIDDSISVGTLVAMAALVTRIYTPLTSLSNARVDVMAAMVSFDRVFEVLDTPNPIEDREDAATLTSPRGEVVLDHVTFAYPTDASIASLEVAVPASSDAGGESSTTVLHDISIEVPAGSLVALVGPSGAGKSTIASLLPRLYDVDEGAVRIDGHDVRSLTQSSLRQAIGMVAQDAHLFHDTVAANLRYARPSATDDELVSACTAAQIHDVVASLPDGYATVVGERGYRFSGGEKQRLAIARMLLKDPAIVVLDEATSHLDAENEILVQQALTTALEGRTALVIAHRLSTIVAADEIVVLADGAVAQRGQHADLLAAGGLYADLFRALQRDEAARSDA